MTPKLEKALNRLKHILPLKERQDDCGKQIKELHQEIIRSFVDKGRILSREEMEHHVSNLEDAIGDDLADLIDRRAAEAEHAVDRLRSKFGRNAVVKGLALDDN